MVDRSPESRSFGIIFILVLCLSTGGGGAVRAAGAVSGVAIVGATLIDGNGGHPLQDATVVVTGSRIVAVGPRTEIQVPAGARIIDGRGKFLTPGFIDTNVHLSLYSAGETFVRYEQQNVDLVLEAAQLHLKYGVTTVRDGYGSLAPLIQIRDAINRGDELGPRILAAGNTIGWGGPYSMTFSQSPEANLTLFQEQINDFITQGTGQDLLDMSPEELRRAVDRYLDKGPDFIKYGAAAHFEYPTMICFSPDAQRVIVEEAHRRGKLVETHATSVESLRIAIGAGIDVLPHAEILSQIYPDDLIKMILDRKVLCSILSNAMTGDTWREHLKARERGTAAAREADEERRPVKAQRPKTAAELRKDRNAREASRDLNRANAEKLIRSGCVIAVSTNNYLGEAPEFRRRPKPETFEAGRGTLCAVEGLVELGMSPSQAIVAATKNGAMACGALDRYGTVEVGKTADLLVLDADPLADISNIRKLAIVIRDGRIVDRDRLPEKPVWYGRPDGRPPARLNSPKTG